MRTVAMTIGPAQAKEYLSRNPGNRPVRQRKVDNYALQMIAGEWMHSHQGIAIDENGELLDGQHRLLAIVESEMQVDMNVSFEVPRATFKTLDQGVKRSIADMIDRPIALVEVGTYLSRVYHGVNDPTPMQVETMIKMFESEFNYLGEHMTTTKQKRISIVPVRAGLLLRLCDFTIRDYAVQNYNNMVILKIQACSPVVASLYRQLMRPEHNVGNNRLGLFLRAYFAFDLRRHDATRLQLPGEQEVKQEVLELIKSKFHGTPIKPTRVGHKMRKILSTEVSSPIGNAP